MKKLLLPLILVLLVGCQSLSTGKLNTSKLIEVEMNDVSDEQKKKIPITYEAPSVEVGLKALPFKMILPEKLPFDAMPFQPPVIDDMKHDGKYLMVNFRTFPKNKEDIIFIMQVDYPVTDTNVPNAEEINLDNKVNGHYIGNTLGFQLENVFYNIVYVNKSIPREQHKKELIEIANQLIKQ